ncbi:hypothetical protein SRRS_23870 [Sporomusa rhizae]|uniref:RNase P modulator RnpM n=1 Tax=Sporomusa rhizae TaxID=357999 RepID=UPI003529F47B
MKTKKIPLRMCVGCQEMKSKKELLRVVRTPEEEIVLDPTGKKAGRGAYMCQSEQCLTNAFKEKRLEKALKHQINEAVYNALRAEIIK